MNGKKDVWQDKGESHPIPGSIRFIKKLKY